MGCEQSRLNHHQQISISYSVIDPTYLKPVNKQLRASLQQNGVNVRIYMSVECFISDQVDSYSNNVVVPQQNLAELLKGLKLISSNPKIFVLGKNQPKNATTQHNLFRITYIQSYEQLKQFDQKAQTPIKNDKKKQVIDLKLLKDFRGDGEPQLFIFEETLKSKGISYKIYSTFEDLQTDMVHVESKVVVTDYVFQNEVIDLLKGKKTKVICFCNLQAEQTYHSHVYFITNNFQQIANEVAMLKSFQLSPLPITKIFLCSKNPRFYRFKSTLEDFALQCREYKELRQILKIAKYYFSLMVICPEEQKLALEKQLQHEGLSFRVQLLPISQQTENSPRGLRKILREVKRGYLVQRGTCKTVDIIDKYHNSSKFQDIKSELQKNQINYRCFDDFNSYSKKLVYCSPFIISNFGERNLIYRYLEQAQSKSKVIIFCNKSKINQQLASQKKWAFVSSHFGKIINYLKAQKIIVPIILDQNQQRIFLKQEKIKNKQQRISLKWSDQNIPLNSIKSIKQSMKDSVNQSWQPSYIVSKMNIPQLQVKQISHDASTLLKLNYHPVDNLDKFKQQLATSLQYLKDKYKLKYPQTIFAQLLEAIQYKSLHGLSKRVRSFFGIQKEMGLKLNQSLKKIESLDQKQLKHLREVVYLLNYNFITYYQMPKIGSFKLVHWTKETLLQNSIEEGVLIFKNFLVMHEEGKVEPVADSLKLQLEIQYNTLNDTNSNISPYFCYEGRFIFAPYTQFKLKNKIKENESVACLELVKQSDFLNYYYTDNVNQNLREFFEDQAIKESTVIQEQEYEIIKKNLERSAILNLWSSSEYLKAAKRQKDLVKKQEQTENIDERYLIELLFQLANYQLKAGLTDDFLTTIQQITANDPCLYIRKECSNMLEKLSLQIQKEESLKRSKSTTKQRSQKCIQLKQHLAQELLSEQNIFDDPLARNQHALLENENCLQIDDEIQRHFEIIK